LSYPYCSFFYTCHITICPFYFFLLSLYLFFFHSSLDPLDLHSFPTRRSSDLLRGRSAASLRQNCVTVFSFSKNHFSSPSGRKMEIGRAVQQECRDRSRMPSSA